MFPTWARQIAGWFELKGTRLGQRRVPASRRRVLRPSPAVGLLEILESRELLTALVGVTVNGNSIRLNELRGGSTSTQEGFTISYTSSQVVLTGTNGTEFRVNGQVMSTDTININGPATLKVHLNQHANDVTISGDGTDSLSSLTLRMGGGRQHNTVTLNQVDTDSLTVHGERANDSLTLNQSNVSGNLNANLSHKSGNTLDLESTTVGGNVRDNVDQLTLNQSTITGTLTSTQRGTDSTLDSTDTTYSGAVSIHMGPSGVVNLNSSTAGSNQFNSSVLFAGGARHPSTVNEDEGSTVFDVTPTYRHATVNSTSTPPQNPTLGAPTVTSQTVTTNAAPVITGTYDATNTSVLTVNANGTTYTLGTSSQLTSPSSGQWSLNLGGATLTSPVTTVTVTSTGKSGNQTSGTGTITDGTGIINAYLKANNLTATTTADGLAYVIETQGTGAVPTNGQTVTVNYSGFLMNTNATKGTEFDSSTDSQFGHVTPFSFKLGAGQVIAGWDEAFALLPVGTTAELIIPSNLAYGASGSGSTIPPNSILIFDVTVISAA